MADTTNFSYPHYAEDHPKFGKSATSTTTEIGAPEAAHLKENGTSQGLGLGLGLGLDPNFASNLADAYHNHRGLRRSSVRKGSTGDFKEFLARRNKRQDSQATLVDFTRRPSRTNEGKFRLQVVSDETTERSLSRERPTSRGFQGSPNMDGPNSPRNSGEHGSPIFRPGSGHGSSLKHPTPAFNQGGQWGQVDWTPGSSQDTHGRIERLDSDATLHDRGSWERRNSRLGSRSESVVQEMFRRRQSSDTTLNEFQRLRQGSFKRSPSIPVLPEIEGSDLEVPKPVQFDNFHQLDRLVEIEPITDQDRGLIIGGIKPLDLDEEKDDRVAEPQLAVADPEVITQEPKSTHQDHTVPAVQEDFTTKVYPVIADPVDPCRTLTRSDLVKQRVAFSSNVFAVNVAMLVFALFAPGGITGPWVLAFILFIKAKDCISSLLGLGHMIWTGVHGYFSPPPPVESKWILSLIPAYSEEEEMIKNCVFSLRDNDAQPHKQVMCIILDGKPRNIKQYMRITHSFRRHYVTSRFKRNELIITAGFMEDVPVICFEKVKNCGKKDSLILCHDLFNVMRDNAPLYTKLLREELEKDVLPALVGKDFPGFDMIFCTDADSTIHKGAVTGLANALVRDPKAIASCGLVLVEYESGAEWSFWNLYQQFQYNFGQFVRRRAEHVWGKVTCLPGCITMIAVRPEMAGAMRKYAAPITAYPVLLHQVQYLGTDRRLTYSMLSQSKDLHTLFVPSAVSETVAPQSLKHYLSQRRRWGSNAYFNNYFYLGGENMIWITRLCASIELIRLTVVYYRIANTLMFIYGLVSNFNVMSLIPLLVVSQLPTMWFLINVAMNKHLRERSHKILLGLWINKIFAPFMSLIIFTNVVRNLGSQAWGLTHGATNAVVAAVTVAVATTTTEEKGEGNNNNTQGLLEERKGSVASIINEEESIGTPSLEKTGSGVSEVTEEETELNELDQIDPREKVVGYITAGL